MERRGHRQQNRPLRAFFLGQINRAFNRSFVTGNNNLPRIIVIRRLTHVTLRRRFSDLCRRCKIQPQQSRHRADTHRHRRLHRLTACPQQTCCISNAQRSSRRKRGIFAQRVTRHIRRGLNRDTFRLKRAHGCQRRRHQGRLRVLCQGQLVLLPFPDQRTQLFAKRLIDFFKHSFGFGIGIGKRLPHSDCLRTLSRKNECSAH